MENKHWLGIDIGSSSTKAVIINNEREIVERCYIRSKDIDSSVKEVLKIINVRNYPISGAGVTGSGREYAKQLIGADLAKTEIIAHAVGTIQIIPQVRTIIDIGCEDCKIILLEDGVMKDFNMNTICSSGMGATLENIASRLGIGIHEFGDIAIQSDKDIIMPMKCGVIMSSAVINKKNAGEKIENILMAVCHAVAGNFLNLTAKGKDLLEPIAFQGMTAHNKGLITAFEKILGRQITIPPSPETMGAFGMAILTQEEMDGRATSFSAEKLILNLSPDAAKYTINHHNDDCMSCGVCYNALKKYFLKLPDGKSTCIKNDVSEGDLEDVKEVASLCTQKLIDIIRKNE